MTDDPTDDPLLDAARQRRTKLVTVIIVAVCCVVVSATAIAAVALWAVTTTAVGKDSRIADLSKQLSAATAQLEASRAVASERASCDRLFSSTTDNSFRNYVSKIGDLVVIISSTPPAPGTPERAAATAQGIAQLGAANEAFKVSANQHAEWLDAGQPIPCPIQPKGATS